MRRRSPFNDRMRALAYGFPPPPSHPDYKLIKATLERRAEMDLEFRLKRSELSELMPSFILTRSEGGSGFPIAKIMRHFFTEYFSRLNRFGPHSFPTSFNVMESFLSFSSRFLVFDLREEREHLLRLHEYMDWYTSGAFPERPDALKDILTEGVVYAYNMVSPLEDFAIDTVDSKLYPVGVAMVRHGHELSAMMVVGENPAFPTDAEAMGRLEAMLSDIGEEGMQVTPGKEGLRPDPVYELRDRYIPELPGCARVIMLARFDLDASRYDARYVNIDIGKSYLVLSDDPMIFGDEPHTSDKVAELTNKLERYSGLFSALASLLYLPAFFVDQAVRIVETQFATNIHAESRKGMVTKAIKLLGVEEVPVFRIIKCLAGPPPSPTEALLTVVPPDMEFQTSGYWKALSAGEIGEAQDGSPIIGKTWVQRTESWSAHSLHSFVISKSRRIISGDDPGWIYIMRSGSHYDDLYKIGLTRRSIETRADELSSATGVPTGFEVLAKWEVADCSRVEREIHERLKPIRVNKRREFFRGNLQMIVSVIDEVLRRTPVTV